MTTLPFAFQTVCWRTARCIRCFASLPLRALSVDARAPVLCIQARIMGYTTRSIPTPWATSLCHKPHSAYKYTLRSLAGPRTGSVQRCTKGVVNDKDGKSTDVRVPATCTEGEMMVVMFPRFDTMLYHFSRGSLGGSTPTCAWVQCKGTVRTNGYTRSLPSCCAR